jgi:hypothetical protein
MLINQENARLCRRCKTRLSAKAIRESKTRGFNRATSFWAILVIAIVLVPCLYGFYKYWKGDSDAKIALAATQKGIEKSVPVNWELEEVKRLHKDFISRLDQNMSDRAGKGFDQNQTLAFHAMTQLKEGQNKYTDPAAQEYFYRFFRLVEKYYDQLVRYNSDSAHTAEARERIRTERDLILNDPSLSPESRSSKLAELWDQKTSESKSASISIGEINETVQSLRNLFASNIER